MDMRSFRLRASAAFLPLLLLLAGCLRATDQVAGGTPGADPLAGSKWFLSSLRGERLLAGTQITIEFADGFIRGSAGCNRYDRLVIGDDVERGKYRVAADGSLTIPGFVVTEVGCLAPEGVMEQETAYLAALRSAVAYRLAEDRLEMQDASGQVVLVYARRALPAEQVAGLAGTAWQLVSAAGRAPAEGAGTVLAFVDDKWFVEHSQCEGYVSSYRRAGHDLSVLGSAWLGQVCQELEGVGVVMLEEPSDYSLAQGRLQITSLSGEAFIYEPLPEAARPTLEGVTWSLLSLVGERRIEGEDVVWPDPQPVLEGSEITLTFRDGTASGSAGCNAYGAAYALEGVSLAIGEVVATEKECLAPEGVMAQDGVMAQEQRFLAAMRGATGYRLVGRQLWLMTDDGWSLVFAVQEPE